MNGERQPRPGVRRVDPSELSELLKLGQASDQSPDSRQSHTANQESSRPQAAPSSFQGQGFGGPRPAYRRNVSPQHAGPAARPVSRPRYPEAAPAASDNDVALNHDELTTQTELASDDPSIFERIRAAAWAERSKRTRIVAGVAVAAVAVAGVGVKAESDKSNTPLLAVLGIGDTNKMTFTEPDCLEPAISGSIDQQSSYILNYRNVVTNKAELDKKKKSKSYKPKTIDSFDDETGAVNMQSDEKPVTPFSDESDTAKRLPATMYEGRLSLGVCNEESMSEVVNVDGSTVEVDASKLALTYDPSGEVNRDAAIAYEKYAPKALGKSNPGYITDKEYERIRKVVIPNEKDPAVNNPKFDNSIIAATLNGLKEPDCLDQVQSTGRKYFEGLLRAQQPDEKFTVTWKSGGFVMPHKSFTEGAETEEDVKIIDSSIECEQFTFENPSSED